MKKGSKYSCIKTSGSGGEDDGGDWEVTMKTEKQMELTRIREPFFGWGYDGDKLRVKFDRTGNNSFTDWEDETFTIYPGRCGTPFYFEPIERK